MLSSEILIKQYFANYFALYISLYLLCLLMGKRESLPLNESLDPVLVLQEESTSTLMKLVIRGVHTTHKKV